MGSPSTGRNKQGWMRIITISLQEFGRWRCLKMLLRSGGHLTQFSGSQVLGITWKAGQRKPQTMPSARWESEGGCGWRKQRSKVVWLKLALRFQEERTIKGSHRSPGTEIILVRVLKWNKGENRRRESAWINGLRILQLSFLSSPIQFHCSLMERRD